MEATPIYSRILVGWNGHEEGRDALALAELLARATGAGLVVASVYPKVAYHSAVIAAGQVEEEMRKETDAAVRAGVEGLDVPGGLETRAVCGSSPAAALHRIAFKEAFDLVVVGPTSHGPIGRLLLGSTGERLLDGAPCAVAVAPKGFADRGAGVPRTIGVGYEGTVEAQLALTAAAGIAAKTEGELKLISVVEPLGNLPPYGEAWPSAYLSGDLFDDLVAISRERVMRALEGLDVPADAELIQGDPAKELAAVSEHGLDLLVVGSRGYGPLLTVLLGGVSSRLVRTASCPVLVVPRRAAETALGAQTVG